MLLSGTGFSVCLSKTQTSGAAMQKEAWLATPTLRSPATAPPSRTAPAASSRMHQQLATTEKQWQMVGHKSTGA